MGQGKADISAKIGAGLIRLETVKQTERRGETGPGIRAAQSQEDGLEQQVCQSEFHTKKGFIRKIVRGCSIRRHDAT